MSLGKYAALVIAALVVFAVCVALYIRFTRTPTDVAYVSEEDGGISVINLKTLNVVKRVHPKNVAPRGIAITFDGNYLFTANKDTADATVFKTRGLSLLKRIPVGDNPEFAKIDPSGNWIYTSFEPGSSGGPPTEGPGGEEEDSSENEPPAEIVALNTGDWSRGKHFTAGRETEGMAFSADGEQLIVANEAQNTLGVYDVETGALSKEVNLASYGRRPRRQTGAAGRSICGHHGGVGDAASVGRQVQRNSIRLHRRQTVRCGLRPPRKPDFRRCGGGARVPGLFGRFAEIARGNPGRQTLLAFHVHSGRFEDSAGLRAIG